MQYVRIIVERSGDCSLGCLAMTTPVRTKFKQIKTLLLLHLGTLRRLFEIDGLIAQQTLLKSLGHERLGVTPAAMRAPLCRAKLPTIRWRVMHTFTPAAVNDIQPCKHSC